ncbi:MAG: DUF4388 domain-containing protein, partial [Anaeromyxobacteraceae bacterium]
MADALKPPNSPPAGGPPRLERVAAPGSAPRPTYGLAERKVTADAAMAAGLTTDGDLAVEGPFRLLYLAAATQASGRLVLGAQGSQFAITVRKGGVEHVLPEAVDQGFGPFLVRKGKLGAGDLAKAEAAKPRAGGDLVGALIALRLVSPADVAPLLQEHGGGLVMLALITERGRFRWDPGVAPPASAIRLGSTWGFLCAAARSLDGAALTARLGVRLEQRAARIGGRVPIEELRLTPQEARAAQFFDGARTLRELAAAHASDAVTILRLALLLGEAELLAFSAGPTAPAPATKPTTPAPAPAPAAVTPAPPTVPPPAAKPVVAPTRPAVAAVRPPPAA